MSGNAILSQTQRKTLVSVERHGSSLVRTTRHSLLQYKATIILGLIYLCSPKIVCFAVLCTEFLDLLCTYPHQSLIVLFPYVLSSWSNSTLSSPLSSPGRKKDPNCILEVHSVKRNGKQI